MASGLAVVSLIVAWITLRRWETSLRIPEFQVGDGTFYNMLTKAIDENGGYLRNPLLGYPKDLTFFDYPLGADNLNLLLIRFISWFSPDFAITVNLWVLLTYPLCAVCAFIALRRLGVSLWSGAAAGLLYAFISYHFRSSGWLLLIGYYALPFAILLVVRLMNGVAIFSPATLSRRPRNWLTRRNVTTVATCAAIASTGLYLASFTLVLLAVGVATLLVQRKFRVAAGGLVAMFLIVFVIAINTSPTLLQRWSEGANTEVPVRFANESEIYGLTLMHMVLPPPFHNFGPAARVGATFREETSLKFAGEDGAYIGLVGNLGLALLVAVALIALTRGVSVSRRRRYGPLVICAATAFLFGTIGGGNGLFSILVHPALRGLGRISVVITFCGLAAIAFALDGVFARARARGNARWAYPLVLIGVVAIGLYDQTGNRLDAAHYEGAKKKWESEERFVTQIESRVQRGAAIYTLPEQQFPESAGPGAMSDYDSAIGYLHSDHLRWSYGAIRGREGKWLERLAGIGIEKKTRVLQRCGFAGIWMDGAGYADPATIRDQLTKASGNAPIVSEEGRRFFFPLAPLGADDDVPASERAAYCDRNVNPVYFVPGDGVSGPEADGVSYSRWLDRRGSFFLQNDLTGDRPVTSRITLINSASSEVTISIVGPDGSRKRAALPPGAETIVTQNLRLGSGRVRFSFTVEGATALMSDRRIVRASRIELEDPGLPR